MKVIVDLDACEGYGQCVLAAPEVFEIPDGAEKVTVLREEPPGELREEVEQAVAVCPVFAIEIQD